MILANRVQGARGKEAVAARLPRRLVCRIRDYRFTMAFLVISGVVFLAASHFISDFAGRSAENNTLAMIQAQSERDSLLFARLVSLALSKELTHQESANAGQLAGDLMGDADVVGISLIDRTLESLWNFGDPSWVARVDETRGAMAAFDEGAAVTLLFRPDSDPETPFRSSGSSVVVSFVPMIDDSTGLPVLVLGIARDVTGVLATEISTTRAELNRSILSVMTIGFGVLLLMVAIVDHSLKRARTRQLEQRLALARLNIENVELERAHRERGRFVAMVSHELRTPLTSILAFAEILSRRIDTAGDERTVEYVDTIRRSGVQLDRLITDLLEAARFQSGSMNIEPIEFDPMILFEDAERQIRPLIEQKRQRLAFDVKLPNVTVVADRGRLLQVISNLLNNSSKYSPAGSDLSLSASLASNVLAVSVTDNGPGVSSTELPYLFRPFYRADNEATRSEHGTGLGLAIVRAIVEAHGGVVEMQSRQGVGTRVNFRVPVGVRAPSAEHVARAGLAEVDSGADVGLQAEVAKTGVAAAGRR